jgi:hypothetical protein
VQVERLLFWLKVRSGVGSVNSTGAAAWSSLGNKKFGASSPPGSQSRGKYYLQSDCYVTRDRECGASWDTRSCARHQSGRMCVREALTRLSRHLRSNAFHDISCSNWGCGRHFSSFFKSPVAVQPSCAQVNQLRQINLGGFAAATQVCSRRCELLRTIAKRP